MFGVQTHRCFLYGRKFKVITAHAALKWLITVKNHQCARLTRWVLKLSEYEFEVLHRPGKKHVNADVLSRHVATIVRNKDTNTDVKPQQEVVLSKEFIKQAQSNDDFCQQVSQALSEGKEIAYFWDQDMVLYHQSPDTSEEPKIVVPVPLREQIIQQHHEPVFAGHQVEKRTLSKLRLHYFLPGMSKDVENFIKRCM